MYPARAERRRMKTERHAKASVVMARTLRKVRISWPPSFGRGVIYKYKLRSALLIVLVCIIIPYMLY